MPSRSNCRSPRKTLVLDADRWDPVEVAIWLAPYRPETIDWRIASVSQSAEGRFFAWLSEEGAEERIEDLKHDVLPLTVDLPEPQLVGIDRLLGAVAANLIRDNDQPAIVVDLGTALTVDVVSREGTFLGGSILPGIRMSARALGEFTDALPDAGISSLDEPPPPLGTSTSEAIASGLFWGPVGAMRILIDKFRAELVGEPLVLLTGGTAPRVAELLDAEVRHEPHLVLARHCVG